MMAVNSLPRRGFAEAERATSFLTVSIRAATMAVCQRMAGFCSWRRGCARVANASLAASAFPSASSARERTHQAWVRSSRAFLLLKNLDDLSDRSFLFNGRTRSSSDKSASAELVFSDVYLIACRRSIWRAPAHTSCGRPENRPPAQQSSQPQKGKRRSPLYRPSF